MSHFGRSGPPDIRDTFSLLVLNISFKTSADDLFPLFDRYGKVVDIFIPRDRRSGDSRGFAFVRYKHSHEAQKALERLDGRNVDGRNISVQFAKYGRDMENIRKGKITRENYNWKRSRSRSPRRSRYREDQRETDHTHGGGRSSSDWHDQDRPSRYDRGGPHKRHRSRTRSRSRSLSPVASKGDYQSKEDDRRIPRRTPNDRRGSPHSSRDSSPRKRSLSPVEEDGHPPKPSASPERRTSLDGSQRANQSRSPTPEAHLPSASLHSDDEEEH